MKPDYSCAQKFSKDEIKTAFVHNFIRFVNWPIEKKSLTLGVIGTNEFTKVLKSRLAGQKVGARNLNIKQLSASDGYDDCDALYITNSKEVNFNGVLQKIKGKTILSIAEIEGFCVKGGIVNLVEGTNGNYLFQINQQRALEEKIHISSKLLKLAIQVK